MVESSYFDSNLQFGAFILNYLKLIPVQHIETIVLS